jgi:hypothetical protein
VNETVTALVKALEARVVAASAGTVVAAE